MALFKCKMCGGTLEINHQESVATCEYCGMQQTLPKLDDDRRANLYDRANHFRRNNEFDKAMGIYEQILNEDGTDAEAYWSLVLCRYGIEYVEDPSSHKRMPTVNRAQFTSIYEDNNYKSALQYADGSQRQLYEEEAKTINEIQKGILAISQKEEPFDVFICYKESDNSGRRTPDSVLAQDLYYQLNQEGFKVFFSRITLEDKIGSAYEPYIFAALNSAKVMVVLGTKPEHFNAVWVKNEWSRYLSLIKSGAKKTLIPAYRDMDPYDLPEEFSHLQAQDMSKLGFMQDLIRGIKKITEAEQPKETVVKETVVKESMVSGGRAAVAPLLRRAFLFLEDGEWSSADEYFERVLDNEPENGEAYLGKLMAEFQVNKKEQLKDLDEPFDEKSNYQKAVRFADTELRRTLECYVESIKVRNENARLEAIYKNACDVMKSAQSEDVYKKAGELFETISGYRDADVLGRKCIEKGEEVRKDVMLLEAKSYMKRKTILGYKAAMDLFATIAGWKDADELCYTCQIEQEKLQEEEERREKRNSKIAGVVVILMIAIFIGVIVVNVWVIPNIKYGDAISLMEEGKYGEAIAAFSEMEGYRESENKIKECKNAINDRSYNNAISLMEQEKYMEAARAFMQLDGYKDSKQKEEECNTIISENNYKEAVALMEAGDYSGAIAVFRRLGTYGDSVDKIKECNEAIQESKYNEAIMFINNNNYVKAYELLVTLDGYKNSERKAESIYDKYIIEMRRNEIEGVEVGETIRFGSYEQDNDSSNGKEKIEWIVIEEVEDKILVISKDALESMPFDETKSKAKWPESSLREWLNDIFFNEAFLDGEKKMISIVDVQYDKYAEYLKTQDRIFLLRRDEIEAYSTIPGVRTCGATRYTQAKNYDDVWWSLDRHPVHLEGFIDPMAYPAGLDWYVRPAMWIDLEP